MSDTNEITNGCLTHYDNRHIQTRIDFMGLCPIDKEHFKEKPKAKPNQECMAKIMRLMETLTDHAKTQWKLQALKAKEKGLRIPQEPKEYPLELSNGAIVELLYHTFEESMVRNCLDYMIELGYLTRKQTKKNAIPIYWFQLTYVQSLLQQQAETQLAGCDFTPPHMQGVNSNPSPVKSHPKRRNSNPEAGFSHPPVSDFTPNNKDKKDNTEKKDKKQEFPATDTSGSATATPPHDVDNPVDKSRDGSRSSGSEEQYTPGDFLPEDGTRATPASRSDVPFVDVDAEDTPPLQQNEPMLLEQPAAPESPPSEQQEPPKRRTPKKVPEGPPVLPPVDAPWNAETIVQVFEAHRGRRYPNGAKRKSDKVRDGELEASGALMVDAADVWTGSPAENRERLLKIATHLETRHKGWWLDTNGHVLPHQLVEKDRVHTMWDELVRIEAGKNGSTSPPPTNGHKPRAPAVLPDAPLPIMPPQRRRVSSHA